MVGLSKKLEEKRAKLAGLIERKAFEAYVRHGVVPDDMRRLAETAADGQKFLDLCAGLSIKTLPDGRPTTHYTWRTAGDDHVRHAHAALEGQVISWTNAPSEGHPGTAPNCRCWAEPYYGNPALPDAFLQLQSERWVSTDSSDVWASIETLTRPDGSTAASEVIMTDGASIRSTFSGQSVSQVVVMPNATFLEVHRNAQVEHLSLGRDREVLARVAWLRGALARGPLVAPPSALAMPEPPTVSGNALADTWLASPFATMVRGALALYNAAVSRPEPMGLGDTGLVALAFKVWDGSRTGNSVTVTQVALTAEQVAQTCKLLPEVQALTNEAAAKMSAMRLTATPQNFGIAVHTEV
ncbi:MAG TPA: phage minor head protein, partial [Devosia sp.]|nr:phage minor head protein [Devosia sp.]